jgi:peptidoglycan LD-endopeptidase CwlK
MDVTKICKDINELNPLVKVMLELALADIKKQGVNPLVVETYRPQERQYYLYCQGRTVSECTSKGISKTFAEKYSNPKANKVTWTLDSIHIQRKAVDIVPQRKVNQVMTAIWNAKDPQTKIIIATMQKYGFEAGANWSTNADSPHFQVKGDFEELFTAGSNTAFVNKAVQTALNNKLKVSLSVNGDWGAKTTAAINKFREKNGWSSNGKLGAVALKELLA